MKKVKSKINAKDGPFPFTARKGIGLGYERIQFIEILKSALPGPQSPAQVVIHKKEQLAQVMKGATQRVPDIDFSKDQLILVALGTEPNNGFDVKITQIMYCFDRGGNFLRLPWYLSKKLTNPDY